MPAYAKILFFAGLILSFSGWISPPVALALGILFGLVLAHPFEKQTRKFTKLLLQASVVALGFGMNLQEVLKAGRSGFVYTAVGISFALAAGLALGRLVRVPATPSFLISSGTAICGGSAIAAVGPIVQASPEEMSVALGTVFILNSVALFIFPAIGTALHLTEQQFGLWAALAIHDTSSVVGAATRYGAVALVIATTVKLARALWIVPLALGTAAMRKTKSRVQIPWFIFLFCLAAVVNSYLPGSGGVTHSLSQLGKLGLTATLFLIGTGISRAALREVGWRPLLQGVLLWLLVGAGSLALIRAGLIGFAG
ncbi:MAG TPA: putative sulfate exporter family transporter [Candidatus Acidoferrales bacterium]|nr:putative sulfate exporter family transporter [Candidatus Acidoferrales bacterium]